MAIKSIFTLTLLIFTFTVCAEDQYQAPDLKIETKAYGPQKMKNENWESDYKVKSQSSKIRGVASEPDPEETIKPMRYPSSVDEGGVHKVEEADTPIAPMFWKYNSEF